MKGLSIFMEQQSWQILQYAVYLDPDFINMEVIKSLFPGREEQITKAIEKLESLSLISIITNPNNQDGFRIDRELEKSVFHSIKNNPNYSINEEVINNNLFSVLNNLFVEVNENPDIKWQIATSLEPHIKKIIEGKPTASHIKVKYANLCYKLSKYYSIVNIDYEKALNYAKIALNERWAIFQNDSFEIADSLNIIGNIYRLSGNAKEGLQYLLDGLRIRKKLYQNEHVDIANSLHNLAKAYNELGEPKKALEYGQIALKMRQKLYPDNHYDIAYSLDILGLASVTSGQFKKALEYDESSLKMRKALYSGNHLGVALSLNNVAYDYYKLGNYKEALKKAKASVDMFKVLYPEGHPRVICALHSYGTILIGVNNIEEGLSNLYQALEIVKKFNMDKHILTAYILYDLGRGYRSLANYGKALEYSEKALRLRQALYATAYNHCEIIESLHGLGDIHLALNDKIKALGFYEQALEISLAGPSPDKLPETKELKQKIENIKFDT